MSYLCSPFGTPTKWVLVQIFSRFLYYGGEQTQGVSPAGRLFLYKKMGRITFD